jgi:hypothetical protein
MLNDLSMTPTRKSLLSPLTYLSLILAISILAISCQKGDTGPVGPTGPTGSIGAQGPQGDTGTANVIYSDWFRPTSYIKDTIFGTWGFYYDDAAPAITAGVMDSGTVITFGKLDGYVTSIWPTNQVEALPIVITYMDGSSANIDTWSALLTTGNLRIQLQSSLNAYGSISTAHQFRYVVIPGGVHATTAVTPGLHTGQANTLAGTHSTGSPAPSGVDYAHMTYQELCQKLGIPE